MKKSIKFMAIQWGLAIFLVATLIVALGLGSIPVSPGDIGHIVWAKLSGQVDGTTNPTLVDIIWNIRLPRVLMAATVGAGLSLAGVVMQASVQNPLAEPFILGIASGASVGTVVAILLGVSFLPWGLGLAGAAFLGAMLSTVLVLFLAGIHKRLNTVRLILAGAVVSALCVALANCIVYMAADAEGMQTAAFWTMGSLADAKWTGLVLPVLAVTLMALYFLSQVRSLDVLLLGEEAAVTLGINASAKRRLYMALVALLTGVMVSQCGVIGFVGLVIPHMVRAFTGAMHAFLLPIATIFGAIFLVWADLLARTVLPTGDLPIGIITALVGAPMFMYLLFGNKDRLGR